MSRKPTIFISSCVYDLVDLRSATKYFLEEQGYAVQASEYADFAKPVDKNSYDACLDAIKRCDVFLLLIGGRLGGWYDEATRVSITQQEYRVAYERAKLGQLVLVSCVRRSVWDQIHRSKRASECPPNGDGIDDPPHLSDFLREVGRIEEMKGASTGAAERPVSNWIHPFSTFRDLVDILSISLLLTRDVSSQLVLAHLEQELVECARGFLAKEHGRINAAVELVLPLVEELHLTTKEAMSEPKTHLSDGQYNRLVDVALSGKLRLKPSVVAIERAATAPGLAEFDPAGGRVRPSELQNACFRVLAALRGLNDLERQYGEAQVQFMAEAYALKRKPKIISTPLVVQILSQGLHHLRAFNEIVNIVLYLRNGVGPLPTPNKGIPLSPLVDGPSGGLADLPSPEEFLTWIREKVNAPHSPTGS